MLTFIICFSCGGFPVLLPLTICSSRVRTTHTMERRNPMGARCKVMRTHGLRGMNYRKRWDFVTQYDWCRQKTKVAIVVVGGVRTTSCGLDQEVGRGGSGRKEPEARRLDHFPSFSHPSFVIPIPHLWALPRGSTTFTHQHRLGTVSVENILARGIQGPCNTTASNT